ncbi:hypothetical protein J3R82DRAFT_8414 [Butyriboletus roseoflavus]|nr:hypothetical protein J3R82DRAFT_8414 [Butyriboletus roseoflavus]
MQVSRPVHASLVVNQSTELTRMRYQPDNRDFAADVRSHVDVFLIPKYTKNMPFRLVDTYTGLILEQSDIVSLLKMRSDYNAKLEAVVWEAEHLAAPIDPECPSQRPKLDHLDSFIAEYLAYAMFSHRWRGREPTFDDVRKATHGIYSMDDKDLVEEFTQVFHLPKDQVSDLPSGIEKLQEFCCLAAKCGFRWAWTDTCCINKKDYAETSESINCMFLWYRSSDLTIVYLDDVDEVKEGRLPAVDDEDGSRWFEDPEVRKPLPPPDPLVPTPSDTYIETLQTKPYLSLHARLRNGTSPQLRSVQPDSQVETPHLQTHLIDNFPSGEDCKLMGKYRKLPIWVTRGWTLQEMIASKRLRFYSKRWTLLEEAEDFDTDEEEGKISISSFRYRARLVDHRANDIWKDALVNTTGVPVEDLVNFKVGTRDIRSRLLWAARRTTTKVEDMAYCLLGIFDISLPAMYGEGPRAFFRLQEELMKRTGDVSLFDWSGRSSSVNTFLASGPECYMIPNLPDPALDDSTDSIFWMIMDLFCAIFQTVWSGVKAALSEATVWIKNIMKSPPPGHALVNGELNVSLFEHRVRCCERLGNPTSNDTYHHYKLEVDGLVPTMVTFASHASDLMNNPTQYYLCRAWNRHTQKVFHIFLELVEYVLKDTWKEFWSSDGDSEPESWKRKWRLNHMEWITDCPKAITKDEAENDPESKLREDMQMKRKEVFRFFKCAFPVYLVHVRDGHGIRVNTVNRVVSDYSKFDFTMPVVTQLIL